MKYLLILLSVLAAYTLAAVETYELRIYHLASGESASQFDAWMKSDGLKAMKKAGAEKVGVFKTKPSEESDNHQRFVLSVYDSLDDIKPNLAAPFIKQADNDKAEAFLSGTKKAPSYSRIESSLLTAFPGFKHLADPKGKGSKQRFFELRVYESSSERLAALKVDMFCDGGEIEIFKETGLNAVFFGSARIAGNFPQLTYLLVHENQEAADKAWDAFRESEDWQTLKSMPKYAGTVSKILKYLLVSLPYSEIR